LFFISPQSFASHYDIYQPMNFEVFFKKIDEKIGLFVC